METERDTSDQASRAVEEKPKENVREPGVTTIKKEYLITDYKPRLDQAYVAQPTTDEDAPEDEEKTDATEEAGEPPRKKVKLKGQNKRTLKDRWRQENCDKLCSAIVAGENCEFGDNCRYSHDVERYMENKMTNLDGECPSYRTFGKCSYGITCRLSTDHSKELTEDTVDRSSVILNVCQERLSRALRKRELTLKRSNAFFSANGIKPNHRMKGPVCDETYNVNRKETGPTESGDLNSSSDTVPDRVTTQGNGQQVESTPHVSEDAETKVDTGAVKDVIRVHPREIKKLDFRDKTYLAPLTTVGNLPFRAICKQFGADITCGEMAMATNILQGKQSEWALLKRHESEDIFGVQLCGGFADSMTRCAELINYSCDVDFIDINVGCPIDLIYNKGLGSALMERSSRLGQIVRGMVSVLDVPLTVKMRTGVWESRPTAHELVLKCRDWGASLVTIHGRSREQRYTKLADWKYISQCAIAADPMPLFGNGDILSYEDYDTFRASAGVAGTMIARGALIKPWIFTEIKERRHWDISSAERLDVLRRFVRLGLLHWGSDARGVETTRRFLLEWLSFLYRYVPVGLLEFVPQKINERPNAYRGRDDLETLMASAHCADWVKISEMLLGPVPDGFSFLPKHKANAYR